MTSNPGSLEGKVALVTGASRGIGRAAAIALARLGAAVAVNYKTRVQDAEAVAREIQDVGGRAVALQADVSIAADVGNSDHGRRFTGSDTVGPGAIRYRPHFCTEACLLLSGTFALPGHFPLTSFSRRTFASMAGGWFHSTFSERV